MSELRCFSRTKYQDEWKAAIIHIATWSFLIQSLPPPRIFTVAKQKIEIIAITFKFLDHRCFISIIAIAILIKGLPLAALISSRLNRNISLA